MNGIRKCIVVIHLFLIWC